MSEPLPPQSPAPPSSSSVPPPPPSETEGVSDAPPSEPPAADPYDVWLPVRPAADFLGVGPRRLKSLRKAGEIPARKRGLFGWEFRENDLMAYVERAAGIAPPAPAEPATPRGGGMSGMQTIVSEAIEKERQANEARDAEYGVNQAPTVRMVNAILVSAIAYGASDIHIEPAVRNVRVRHRINGAMREIMAIPLNLRDPIARRFCIMADLDPFGKKLQMGRIPIVHMDKRYNLRVLATPTLLGVNITVHILPTAPMAIGALGMTPDVMDALYRAAYPYGGEGGLLLFSGPTGSGLTTTATAVINKLNSIEKKIVALVPVVEYELGGVHYMPVQSEIGVGAVGHHRLPTISEALSAVLYGGDADIVFLGDIVGLETARAALLASESGLKVLATINAPTPSLALRRIAEWTKVSQERVACACHGVLTQRLLRRLNKETKIAKQTTVYEMQRWLPHRAINLPYQQSVTVWEPDPAEVSELNRKMYGEAYREWAGRIGVFAFANSQTMDAPDSVRFELEKDVVLKVTTGITTLEEGYAALR